MSDQRNPSEVHAWLRRNKVYFEAVAATVFILASILVAFLQWQTARRQEEISTSQIQPNFVVAVHTSLNPKEDAFTDNELLIRNFGGPPRGLHDETTTFLHITTLSNDGKEYSETDIPFVGYYFSESIASDSVAGLMIKKTGYRNNEKMAVLTDGFRKIAAADGYICNVRLRVFVKLAYTDLFDQSHLEYFSVESAGVASPISASEGNKWVDRFNLVRADAVDLDTITAQKLWEKLQPKKPMNPIAVQTPTATTPPTPATTTSTAAAAETPIPSSTSTASAEPVATPLPSPSSTPATEKAEQTPAKHSRPRHHHHRS